jgi:hypothetical protein
MQAELRILRSLCSDRDDTQESIVARETVVRGDRVREAAE